MPKFTIDIRVMPRPALLDPQGQAVEHALTNLGFEAIESVRMGKALTFDLERNSADQAQRDAQAMCEKLLSNPVTEDFTVHVSETA